MKHWLQISLRLMFILFTVFAIAFRVGYAIGWYEGNRAAPLTPLVRGEPGWKPSE